MKQVTGYEVVYTGTFTDGTQEQMSMCASESRALCHEWLKNEINGWLVNGWEIMSQTPGRVVMRCDQGVVTHEVLHTTILK